MNKKIKVLVFPCGSEIGLEIHKALSWSTYIELFGASSVSDHGQFVYKNYISKMPFIDEHGFIEKLNKIIDKYKIDFIYPAHDSVVLKLSENQDMIRSKVIGSPPETCKICRSKAKTYKKFKSKLLVPQMYEITDEDIQLPVFLKPDVGQGSKGTFVTRTKEEMEILLKKDKSLLILEYLPGREYTVDCFTDRNATLRFVGARERIRIMNGISVDTKPVLEKKLDMMAQIINSTLKFRGAWFFQVKENKNNEFTLIEIAPRIAGAMALYRNLGVNFPLLSVFDAMDKDVKIYTNKYSIEMDRALINRFKTNLRYKYVYIDLDDTIIFNDNINPFIIAFIFQCKNRGIKVYLFSKHKGNIRKTLCKYNLESLFDKILNIHSQEEKSDYISEKSSLFIDDSFSERLKIAEKLKIPVFDTNAIESLIDWRY